MSEKARRRKSRRPCGAPFGDLDPEGKRAWIDEMLLYRRAYLLRRLSAAFPGEEDLEDILHESVARLLEVDVERLVNPLHYLNRMAFTLLIDRQRRERCSPVEPRGDIGDLDRLRIASADPLPDRRLSARQTLGIVGMSYYRLPPKIRATARMRIVEERRQADIAKSLEVTLSCVEKRLKVAAASLRVAREAA